MFFENLIDEGAWLFFLCDISDHLINDIRHNISVLIIPLNSELKGALSWLSLFNFFRRFLPFFVVHQRWFIVWRNVNTFSNLSWLLEFNGSARVGVGVDLRIIVYLELVWLDLLLDLRRKEKFIICESRGRNWKIDGVPVTICEDFVFRVGEVLNYLSINTIIWILFCSYEK